MIPIEVFIFLTPISLFLTILLGLTVEELRYKLLFTIPIGTVALISLIALCAIGMSPDNFVIKAVEVCQVGSSQCVDINNTTLNINKELGVAFPPGTLILIKYDTEKVIWNVRYKPSPNYRFIEKFRPINANPSFLGPYETLNHN